MRGVLGERGVGVERLKKTEGREGGRENCPGLIVSHFLPCLSQAPWSSCLVVNKIPPSPSDRFPLCLSLSRFWSFSAKQSCV